MIIILMHIAMHASLNHSNMKEYRIQFTCNMIWIALDLSKLVAERVFVKYTDWAGTQKTE